MRALNRTWDSEVFLLRGDSRDELIRQADRLRQRISDDNLECRDVAYTLDCVLARDAPLCLAIVAGSLDDLRGRIDDSVKRLADPDTHRIKERRGIYFFDSPLGPTSQLAFLFPGEGSQYRNMLADLCLHFPEVREWFDLIDRAFAHHPRQYLPSQVIFGPASEIPEALLWQMDCGSEVNFAANQALCTLLRNLEIRPNAVLGHSAGEYSAMHAAGAVRTDDREQIVGLIRSLNEIYEQLRRDGRIPEAQLCAVTAPERELVIKVVDDSHGRLFVAMDNCPHQIVLYGETADLDEAKARLTAAGCLCNPLPFGRAYHTPLFAPFTEALTDFVGRLDLRSPETPIYSGMTAQVYPSEQNAMKRLAAEHWMRPVRFRETVEAMYASGIRIFVEVGARGNLTSFVDDTLRGRNYAAIPANIASRSGIEQLNHLVALLAAHRVPMNLQALFHQRSPKEIRFEPGPELARGSELDRSVRVSSSLPLLQLAANHGTAVAPEAAALARPDAPLFPRAPGRPASSRAVAMSRYHETMQTFLAVNEAVVRLTVEQRRRRSASPLDAPSPAYPFIGRIVSLTPGRRLTAVRMLHLDEDLFLRDHVLGPSVISQWDSDLTALPVVPLTMSIEMLAEAAATLLPQKRVAGLKEIRAHRWLTLSGGSVTLRLTAERTDSSNEIGARIYIDEDPGGRRGPETLVLEGTVLLADTEPPDARPTELRLTSDRPSRWGSRDLYSTGMFHGPRFQGVASVDRCADDGAMGTLRALPSDSLFRSDRQPRLLTDPVLLDAAGQIIGFWAMETRDRAFNVFPFRVASVELHRNDIRVGELPRCRARIELSDSLIRSDIDVIAPDGRQLTRLAGWEDRRIDLPENFFRLRISPRDHLLAAEWPLPTAPLAEPDSFVCCRIDDISRELLRSHGSIWEQVLAHLVLSRRERKLWRELATAADRRRHHWLLGRCAAKDAVRLLWKKRRGLELYPADVEIEQDEHGRPMARGEWANGVGMPPQVSLTHIDGLAVALASDGPWAGVGIDVERISDRRDGLADVAFTLAERNWLNDMSATDQDEWVLRFWCAKEAALKALGRGLARGPQAAIISDVQKQAGALLVSVSEEYREQLGLEAETTMTAYTGRDGDVVYATVAYGRD